MGCGSSSTTVKSFNNTDNRAYQEEHTRQRENNTPVRTNRPSSAVSKASSRTSKSSKSGRQGRKQSTDEKQTEPDTTTNVVAINTQDNNNDDVLVSNDVSQNQPDITKVNDEPEPGSLNDRDNEVAEQGVVTADSSGLVHESQTEVDNKEDNSDAPLKAGGHYVDEATRAERHERIAKEKADRRDGYDYDLRQQEELSEICEFTPINMDGLEPVDEDTVPRYTNDDIESHNEGNPYDWFKFGRKVYSNYKFWPIVQQRFNEYQAAVEGNNAKVCPPMQEVSFPVMAAAANGVARKDIRQLLPCCLVGHWDDVPMEIYIERMRESAGFVLEELNGGYTEDYEGQVNRWLSDCPNVKRENKLVDYTTDPNELSFPLPEEIRNAPNTLRQWIETYEPFDTEVPSDGAWTMVELVGEELGDIHKVFANIVAEDHADVNLDDLDMEIEGEAGWNVIEIDLYKNDVTTAGQENVWKSRESRTNLNDPDWMMKRRKEIADFLTKRHEWSSDKTEIYLLFADTLENAWKHFQELCDKEFVPPQRGNKDNDQMPDATSEQEHRLSDASEPVNDCKENGQVDTPEDRIISNGSNGEHLSQQDRQISDGGVDEGLHQREHSDMNGNDSSGRRPKSEESSRNERDQEPMLASMDSGLDMITGEQVDNDVNGVQRNSGADVTVSQQPSN